VPARTFHHNRHGETKAGVTTRERAVSPQKAAATAALRHFQAARFSFRIDVGEKLSMSWDGA